MGRAWFGERVGVAAWGTEFSKSSARSRCEKVRFASSATIVVSISNTYEAIEGVHTLLEVQFTMRSTLLLFRRGSR